MAKQDSDKKIAEIENKVSKYRTVEEYGENIDKEKLNVWEGLAGEIGSTQKSKDIMRRLLSGKVNDSQLLEDIIKNAGTVVRHRITATFYLKDRANYSKTKLKAVGILPEEVWEVKSEFEESDIDPTSFNARVKGLKDKLAVKYGLRMLDVDKGQFPKKNFSCSKVNVRFDFV